MSELTPRQREVLFELALFTTLNGFAPPNREIAARLGITSVCAFEHLADLQAKGLIRRTPWNPRLTVITEAGRRALGEK